MKTNTPKTETQATPKVRTKPLKANLDYHFTPDELRALGKELAESQIKLRQLEDDRKMVADEWKAKISSEEANTNSLANKVSSGYEYRDIPCTVTYDDPIPGQKTIRRDDSNEVVRIAEMTEDEKQTELAFAREAEATKGGAA